MNDTFSSTSQSPADTAASRVSRAFLPLAQPSSQSSAFAATPPTAQTLALLDRCERAGFAFTVDAPADRQHTASPLTLSVLPPVDCPPDLLVEARTARTALRDALFAREVALADWHAQVAFWGPAIEPLAFELTAADRQRIAKCEQAIGRAIAACDIRRARSLIARWALVVHPLRRLPHGPFAARLWGTEKAAELEREYRGEAARRGEPPCTGGECRGACCPPGHRMTEAAA